MISFGDHRGEMSQLQDAIRLSPEEMPIEDICSPIASQILDFCDDDDSAGGDLFPPSDYQQQQQQQQQHLLLHSSSDVSTSSATTAGYAANTSGAASASPICCYTDDDVASFSPFASLDASAISAFLDGSPPDPDPDLVQAVRYACSSSAATSSSSHTPPTPMFSVPPVFQDPFDHMTLVDAITGGYQPYTTTDQVMSMQAGGAPNHQHHHHHHHQQEVVAEVYNGDPRYGAALVQQSPYGFYEGGGGGMRGLYQNGGGMGDAARGFHGGVMMVTGQEEGFLGAAGGVGEYQRMENVGLGMYGQDAMPLSDLQQVIGGGGNQHLMTGCSSSSATTQAADVSTLDDQSTFKVGRLSVEERKEKIHRYMKKRNERNFSKKIKYACRKTLADSRPRVRGRFAKNDEFGETTRPTSSSHEFDDEEELPAKVEDDILNSSDILAHISGVNSFKYNYPLESWI